MIIDKKGRLFGKFNFLDVLFILLFIAAIVFVVFFAKNPNNENPNDRETTITYTVEIQNQDADYFDQILIGEDVIEANSRFDMGKVINVTKEPAKLVGQADDKLLITYPEGRYDGYVQIEAEATIVYPNIRLSNHSIKIGNFLSLRTANASANGYVTAIECDEALLEETREMFKKDYEEKKQKELEKQKKYQKNNTADEDKTEEEK